VEGEYEDAEGEDAEDDLDDDLQAALMEKLDRSDESGSEEDSDLEDEEEEDDEGERSEDDDEETIEHKAKIKQYTSEVKQLETLIEKKRAGFTGGNPIITKRFEETIKGLQEDVNTKVAARQALLEAIEAKAAAARKAAEPEPTQTEPDAEAEGEAEAEGDEDMADLFDDYADGEDTPVGTPMATPGLPAATPLPGESPAPDIESDDEDLFGDGDDDDDGEGEGEGEGDAEGEGEGGEEGGEEGEGEGEGDDEDDEMDEDGDITMEDDEMDEMALLLQAELGKEDAADVAATITDPETMGEGAVAAAEAELDAFARAEGGFTPMSLTGTPTDSNAALPMFGVEGGVGMRRLASGVEDDSSGSEEEDSD
jgi:transcription initiation factor TFIID subunit 7